MGKKKGKRTTPKKIKPINPEVFAALLARGGVAVLQALPGAVEHGFVTPEGAAMLAPLIQAEVLNASVFAATN